jgi:hypothetical protein
VFSSCSVEGRCNNLYICVTYLSDLNPPSVPCSYICASRFPCDCWNRLKYGAQVGFQDGCQQVGKAEKNCQAEVSPCMHRLDAQPVFKDCMALV